MSIENQQGISNPEIEVEKIDTGLSPEVVNQIMKKVCDINSYGTAFSVIGSNFDKCEIGREKYSKFRNILKHGLVGVSPVRPGINRGDFYNPNSELDYISDIKKVRQNKEEPKPEVFFNIIGRERNSKGKAIMKDYSSTYPEYVAIIFNLSHFKEKTVVGHSYKQIEDKKGVEIGTFTPENYHPPDPISGEGYSSLINERGESMSFDDYGFKLAPRVPPRLFSGIVFRLPNKEISEKDFYDAYRSGNTNISDRGGKYYILEMDSGLFRRKAETIAKDMLLSYSESEQYLVPIYDDRGNLWWPKEMSYEEVKKLVQERNTDLVQEGSPSSEND